MLRLSSILHGVLAVALVVVSGVWGPRAAAQDGSGDAAPSHAEPVDGLRQLGEASRAAEAEGGALAERVLGVARDLTPLADEAVWAELEADLVTHATADAVGVTKRDLELVEVLQSRVAILGDRVATHPGERADLVAAIELLHARAYDPGRTCQPVWASWIPRCDVWWAELRRAALRAAHGELARFDTEARTAVLTVDYLDRRITALTPTRPVHEAAESEEVHQEIDEEQALLAAEVERTDALEARADLAERRATEARAEADRVAQELAAGWEAVAPALTRVAEERRRAEARLAALSEAKEAFLVVAQADRDRVHALAAQPDEPRREAQADALYASFQLERVAAREEVDVGRLEQAMEREREAHGAVQEAVASDVAADPRYLELRTAELELAEAELALAQLRREVLERETNQHRRRVFHYAVLTDELIPLMSREAKREVFRLSQANIRQARRNFVDRRYGLELLLRERRATLVAWVSSLSVAAALRWGATTFLLIVGLVAFFRALHRRRDAIFEATIKRLETSPWAQRHILATLKTLEVLHDALLPLSMWLALKLAERWLPPWGEVELLWGIAKLVLLYVVGVRVAKTVLIPISEKPRDEVYGRYRVDVVSLEPRTAGLFVLTARVWLIYTIAGLLSVRTVHFGLGDGFTPHLVSALFGWGQVVVVYALTWSWRDLIVERFVRLTDVSTELAGTLEKHKARAYSVIVLAFLGLYVVLLGSYRYLAPRVVEWQISRRVSNFVYRRRIERAQQAATTTQEVRPVSVLAMRAAYRSLFDPGDVLERRQVWVDRPAAVDPVMSAWRAWQADPGRGTVALIGDAGMGKTMGLALFDRALGKAPRRVRGTVEQRCVDADEALRWIAARFEVPFESEAQLISAISEGPQTVALIDDAHMLFLRAIGGFGALEAFLRVASLTNHVVFWVLTFNRSAWHYVNRVHDRRHHFRAIVDIPAMTAQQAQEMIENRNVIGGYSPGFQNLMMTRSARGAHYLEVVKTASGYFRLLTEFAAGNPRIINHYWLRSVTASSERTLTVELFQKPDESTLKDLKDNQLFVLTAIAQHEMLRPEEIAEVIALELGRCAVEVNFLDEVGLLDVDGDGVARLTARMHRQVMHRLRLSNLLYFEA